MAAVANAEMCVLTESAIVWISKCLNQQTSFQSQQMAGVAKISKCLSQQMSRPSQQMSDQQMSVSKCPVSKWKISKVPDTLPRNVVGLKRTFNKNKFSTFDFPMKEQCCTHVIQNILFQCYSPSSLALDSLF